MNFMKLINQNLPNLIKTNRLIFLLYTINSYIYLFKVKKCL